MPMTEDPSTSGHAVSTVREIVRRWWRRISLSLSGPQPILSTKVAADRAAERSRVLHRAMSKLDSRERLLVDYRHLLGWDLERIGRRHKLSRGAARVALRRLQTRMRFSRLG